MLIKTVVDENYEGAKQYKSRCKLVGEEKYESMELILAEIEYSEAFVDALSRQIADFYMHTVFTYDYESSSDAGDGRDECYTEERSEEITLDMCVIKDDKLYGVLCESFDVQGFVLLECPETIIYHPGNYGGRNYHFYREKSFALTKKEG